MSASRFSLLLSAFMCCAALAQTEAPPAQPTEAKQEKPRSKFVKQPKSAKKDQEMQEAAKQAEPEPLDQTPLVKPVVRVTVDVMAAQFFREALSPFGEWMDVQGYGRCWKPTGVGPHWAPYTVGEWAYSDYGWTWVSAENFGDIVYHANFLPLSKIVI